MAEGTIIFGKDGKVNLDAFLVDNSAFVMQPSIAFSKKYGIPVEDLFQEGCVGLMIAKEKYDIRKGTKFTTYAYNWVIQCIREYCYNQSLTVRIPKTAQVNLSKRIRENGGVAPKDDPDVKIHGTWRNISSLDNEEPDFKEPGTEIDFENERFKHTPAGPKLLKKLRDNLTGAEYFILNMRMGLESGESYSLGKVGYVMCCSREWVNVLEKKIIDKLRDVLTPGDFEIGDYFDYERE